MHLSRPALLLMVQTAGPGTWAFFLASIWLSKPFLFEKFFGHDFFFNMVNILDALRTIYILVSWHTAMCPELKPPSLLFSW